MKRFLLMLLAMAAWLPLWAGDDAPRRAELRLKDDTVVVGTVVALKDGAYTINSPSLGTMQVAAAQVVALRYLDAEPASTVAPAAPAAPTVAATQPAVLPPIGPAKAAPAEPAKVPAGTAAAAMPAAAASMPPQMQGLMTQIMSDPAVMSQLDQLLNDPQVLEILNDSETMKQVNGGNYLQLMTNPKFLKLMAHPAIRQIAGEVVNPTTPKPAAKPAEKAPEKAAAKPVAKPAPAPPPAAKNDEEDGFD